MSQQPAYDLAIHLVGGQTIPNLIGIRTIPAKRHLLLTSPEMKGPSELLKRYCDKEQIDRLDIPDAFDIPEIIRTLSRGPGDHIGVNRIALNLTGGTKPMAFAAQQWGLLWNNRKNSGNTDGDSTADCVMYYFDTGRKHYIVWGAKQPYEKRLMNEVLRIADFLQLSEFAQPGFRPEIQYPSDMNIVRHRREISMKIWEYRYAFQCIQADAQEYLNSRNQKKGSSGKWDPYFSYSAEKSGTDRNGRRVTVICENGRATSMTFDGKEFLTPSMYVDVEYLAGRWFEEYTFHILEPLMKSGQIREMELGLKVMYDSNPDNPAQEFDLLVTDGLRLLILECKAGKIGQANLDKLENITKKFAGIQGLGILVSRWYQKPENAFSVIERTEKSENFACVHGDQIPRILPENLFTLRKGQILDRPENR